MQVQLIQSKAPSTHELSKDLKTASRESANLKILMVVESSAGGTGRHVLDLCEGLLGRGFEVHVLFSMIRANQQFLGRIQRMKGIIYSTVDMRVGIHSSDLAAVTKVRRYLREQGPFDVIHGHSSKGGAIARLASIGKDVRVFFTPHMFISLNPTVAPLKKMFYVFAERALGPLTTKILAVSPEEARALLKHGLGRSRVVVVPNGIPPLLLASRAEARYAIGVSDETPIIGFVGRLVEQKAPHVLIQAFAEASNEIPEARLAMVGSGPLESSLREVAERLNINDRIIWLGERDVSQILPGFDCFAMSSRNEGLPYVAIEAMSAGLPIVATETSGVEILVEEGANGFVVPQGNTKAMAAALIRLVTNPALRSRHGRSSYKLSKTFTIDMMVDRIINVYQSTRTGLAPPPAPSLNVPPVESVTPTSVSRNGDNMNSVHQQGKPMQTKPRSAELHAGPGFRINTNVPSIDPTLIDRFRDFDTPDISDLLNRLYAVDPRIHCLTGPEHAICGPACTVKVFPGDNLMVHKSLDIARPGDIVVVDAGASRTNAVLGDLISAKAKHRKIQGFVVDGLIRDLPAIEELDFPVYARGTTPIGPLHRGPGEINYPVCCGGIVVNPGDLIVGDAAGVIIVPLGIAEELIGRLEKHRASNKAYFEAVRRGEFSNAWVDGVLESQGYVANTSSDKLNSLAGTHDLEVKITAQSENCAPVVVA